MKKALPLLLTVTSGYCAAGNFGIYDPRSQAMGGTAVAIGSVEMASGHNPALLGLFDEDEDKSRNGRYYLPYAVGTLSNAAIDSIEVLQDELDVAFDNALSEYNRLTNPQSEGYPNTDAIEASAAATSDAAGALEEGLTTVANEDITFSIFAPLIAVAEPGKQGGGGFYVGSRVEGGGRSYIPDDDIELFEDYVEALDNVAAGNNWRDVHPELFADDGSCATDPNCDDSIPPPLNDPFDDIESRADVVALVINEAVIASAWGVEYEDMRFSFGVTPKAMQILVFDESREVSDNEFETSATSEPYLKFNLDVGIAIAFDNGVRIGYTGKDLFSESFDSAIGTKVKLSTKHRLGLGVARPTWQLGLDYDMQQAEPLATEKTGQYLSFGGEYSLFERLHLRAGYRYDTSGTVDGAASFGIGFNSLRTHFNISYLSSSEEKGAGIQLGFTF